MINNASLGVIVPFYNEERFLLQSVSRLLDVKIVEQIVLVDDCSEDKSYSIAESILEKSNKISLIKTDKNGGKGYAVKKGLEFITTSHILVHDADLEYFPEDIPEIFNSLSDFENCLVIGSRTVGDKKRKNLYFYTYFGNKVLSLLFSIINNYKISDIASCYWLVNANKLRSKDLRERGFGIEVEVLSKFLKNNVDIVEVPIRYEARSYQDGKKIKLKDGIIILLKILKYSKLNIFN
tara:strand:- start:84 stop:794 length:711 start_codon:yes stop_codon:yes gene_type:complete